MNPGQELAGRYRLERMLGQGAFSEVWAAIDLLRDRLVAIKFLHPNVVDSNPIWLGKFRQEAKIAVRLEHPGIASVDDFGEAHGQWYLAMEFLDGQDLADELRQHPTGLPIDRVVLLGMQIADALAVAHEHGVVHRDLKPANIMLLAEDRVKICDFGIAHFADASTTGTLSGRMVGTPAYMAPEQWRGEAVDQRTDLYALGVVLYALLTGVQPFSGTSVHVLMQQHLTVPPTPTRTVRPAIPEELDNLVMRLLSKNPDSRPSHAAHVRVSLAAIIGLSPETPSKSGLSVPPPSTTSRRRPGNRPSSAPGGEPAEPHAVLDSLPANPEITIDRTGFANPPATPDNRVPTLNTRVPGTIAVHRDEVPPFDEPPAPLPPPLRPVPYGR